jgi:putative aldouronate transport system substrate-binding protein
LKINFYTGREEENFMYNRVKRISGIFLTGALVFFMLSCSSRGGDSGAAKASGQKPKITVAVMDFGTFPSDRGTLENNDITRWINEKSPVQVEFVPVNRGEVTSLYTAMLAAGTAPDIISDYDVGAFERFVIDESLLGLDDLVKEHGQGILANVAPEVLKEGYYNGLLYAIPKMRDGISVPNWMIWIRQDWLDNLGLKMPTNFDEFYDVMYAFTFNDPDRNGLHDTYGFGAGAGESAGGGPSFGGIERLLCLYGGMRGRWLPYGPNGSYDHVAITVNRRDGYKFAEKLFDNSLINPEFFTMTGQQCRTEFITGKVGTIGMQISSIDVAFLTAMKDVNPNAKVAPLKTLVSPYGQFAYLHERAAQMHIMLPKTCSNPVAAMQYLNWMVTDGWQRIIYGIEGEHFTLVNRRIVPIGDAQKRAHDLAEARVLALATGYRMEIADLELQLEYNKDTLTEIEKESLEARIASSLESLSHEFIYYVPTEHLGLESSATLIPTMNQFAVSNYEAAVIDKNVTVDQAYTRILAEYDALGYQDLRREYNERVKELDLD